MVNQSQNALQELQQLCMVSTSKLIQSKWELGSVQHGNTMVSFPWYNKMSLQTFLTVWIFQNKFSKISMAVLCKQSTYSKSKINLLVRTVLHTELPDLSWNPYRGWSCCDLHCLHFCWQLLQLQQEASGCRPHPRSWLSNCSGAWSLLIPAQPLPKSASSNSRRFL